MAPKTFLDLLVQAVDQEELRSRLENAEDSLVEDLRAVQREIDRHRTICSRLAVLPAKRRRAVQTVIDSQYQLVEEREDLASLWSTRLSSVEAKKATAAFRRRRAFAALYKAAQQAINKSVTGSPTSEEQFPMAFSRALGQLLGCHELLAQAERDSGSLRKRYIRAMDEAAESRAAMKVAKAGQDPSVAADAKETFDAAENRRVDIHSRYTAAERRIQVQRELQLDRERDFFLGSARSFLVDAGKLPSPHSPTGSSSAGSLSYVSRHSSARASLERSDGRDAEIPEEPRQPATSELSEPNESAVSTAAVREAQRLAYQVRQALDSLRDGYTEEMVNVLMTFTNLSWNTADMLYARDRNGNTFRAAEAAMLHDLLQAEANHSWLRAQAKAAGLEGLPLSPISMADASSDGHATTDGESASGAQEVTPKVRRWQRRVARAANKDLRATRPDPSFSLSTVGSRRPSDDFPGIGHPNQDRNGRFKRMWFGMQDRTRQQSKAEMGARTRGQAAVQNGQSSHRRTHPAENDGEVLLDAWGQEAAIAAGSDVLQWSPVIS